MSGSVKTAYDCEHPPKGKPLLSAYIRRASTLEIPLTQTSLIVSLSFKMEMRIESHIWRHMYGFQLLVSDYVPVPEALSVFCFPVQQCSVSLFLTLCVYVCLNVCVWMHKLLTLSVFMLASRTSAKQCSKTFILSFRLSTFLSQ